MKKKIIIIASLVVAVAAALSAILLTQCKKKDEQKVIWVNYGDRNDIPCLQIPDAEYATVDEFRYILRKANKIGVNSDWGYVEQKVKEENRPIENRHYGNDVYLSRYVDMTLERYNDFVADMESQGFQVLAKSNIEEKVYTTALTYKGNSYTVSYFATTKTIDVTASKENHLSPYLQKENASTEDKAVEGLSTTLTVRPLRGNSTGYVIQLPNGHYVIGGGGTIYDLAALLTYLEENAPAGEIPVVEAWFVSSANYDLCNWIMGFSGTAGELKYAPELLEPVPARDRIRVNGIYYNLPGADIIDATVFEDHRQDGETYYSKVTNPWPNRMLSAGEDLQTEDGKQTPIYRPMSGQIYYFNGGLTVEVPLTQEQFYMEEYEMEWKVSSSCLLFRQGEQTYFDMGYICEVNQARLVETYGKEYFRSDVLMVSYRGRRMFEAYQDVFCGEWVLYPNSKVNQLEPEYAAVYTYYKEQPSINVYSYPNGTFRYDFTTGEATVIPKEEHQPLS